MNALTKSIAVFVVLLQVGSVLAEETAADAFKAGLELYNQRKYLEALPHFTRAVELTDNDKTRISYEHYVAYSHYRLKDYDKARELFRKLADDSAATPVQKYNAIRHIATTYQFEKNYDEANKYFQQVVDAKEAHPGHRVAAQMAMGHIQQHYIKDYDKAIELYNEALTFDNVPTSSRWAIILNIGSTYHRAGKLDEAVEAFDQVINGKDVVSSHRSSALLQKANLYYRNKKDYETAKSVYQQVVEMEDVIAPHRYSANYYIVICYRDLNQLTEARNEAQQLLADEKFTGALRKNLEKILRQMQDK